MSAEEEQGQPKKVCFVGILTDDRKRERESLRSAGIEMLRFGMTISITRYRYIILQKWEYVLTLVLINLSIPS